MKRSPADLRGLAARARRDSLGVACLGCSGVCATHTNALMYDEPEEIVLSKKRKMQSEGQSWEQLT